MAVLGRGRHLRGVPFHDPQEVVASIGGALPAPAGSGHRVPHVDRLIGRLRLLHECYEQAMDELGLPRPGGRVDSTPQAASDTARSAAPTSRA